MARRYFTGLAASYIALITNALMMIILMPFFLHHLGEEMTGIYIMIASLSNVMNMGVGWLSDASSLTISARARKNGYLVKPIYRMQQLVFGAYGFGIALLFFLSSVVLPNFWNAAHSSMTQVQISLFLFGCHYIIYILHNGDVAFLGGQLRIALANGFRSTYNLLFSALAVGLLYVWPNLQSVFAAQLITTIIMAVASQFYMWKYRLNWLQFLRPRGLLWRAILVKMGGPLAGISGLWAVMAYADNSLIGFLLGPAAAAQYFAGTKIADTLALLLIRISETAIPFFARLRRSPEDQRFFYTQFQRALLYLAIIAAIGYGFFGQAVMQMWLGPSASVLPRALFWLAGIAIIFRVLVKHEYNVIIALQFGAKVLPITIFETILRVAALATCIYLFGLIGGVLSVIVVYAGGIYWFLKFRASRIIGLCWRGEMIELGLPLVLSAVAFAIWFALQSVIPVANSRIEQLLSALLLTAVSILVPLAAQQKWHVLQYGKLSAMMKTMTRD